VTNADGTRDPVPDPMSPEPVPNADKQGFGAGGAKTQSKKPDAPNNGNAAPPSGFPGGAAFPGGFIPGMPQPKPEEPPEPLPPFSEYPNPHKPGKQTRLKPTDVKFTLPALPTLPASKFPPRGLDPSKKLDYLKVVFSSKHNILAAMGPSHVALYDAKSNKLLGTQKAKKLFSDLSLAPDESALFVADFGGENIGYSTPLEPSRVHRYDFAKQSWEDREAPKIAYRIEAIDGLRVILLEQDQWVHASVNKWETDGVGIRELSRLGGGYYGDIEYDPRNGRLYHGGTGSSSQEILVQKLLGSKLKQETSTGTYGSASGGGPTLALSHSGTHLYYGNLQFDVTDFKNVTQKYPETIHAASRDIAFGRKSYYRTTTGSKLGDFPIALVDKSKTPAFYEVGGHPAIAVGTDGQTVWAIEHGTMRVHKFTLTGEQ
jgi:hypothetical protein